MPLFSSNPNESLRSVASSLEAAGANLTITAPGMEPIRLGGRAEAARVTFHSREALAPLSRGDHLRLAEAYLQGKIDFEGDTAEIIKVTDQFTMEASPIAKLALWLRLVFRNRARYDKESVAFHYDRPVEFFLPWLDRWRCYSHGIYATPEDAVSEAIARKMQYAIDALALEPDMEVLDMGGGWGCFVEYAGLQGIRIHAITISEQQHRFVKELIREKELPCTVELVNFREYRPRVQFDGAVFMGTFEHFPEYERAVRFLRDHLKPRARMWADFCAQRVDFSSGRFMKKYIWPGPTGYVNPYRLARILIREGFNIHELRDDTQSYAYTVRDWVDAFQANEKALSERFGMLPVRAFHLFLLGSYHFLRENKTQAYHLVASREPAPLGFEPRRAAQMD
jgi:cyclopropane-fatty-acyl-phospholipid synthase